jgi:nitric-oxide synthase
MINATNYSSNLTREKDAVEYLRQYFDEMGQPDEARDARITEVIQAIRETGSYSHTYEELSFGARVAWRNNARCVGRLFWESLEVIDERAASTEQAIADALLRHIAYATNDGRIRPLITVFAPELEGDRIRIWNHQLIRYAGYETADGTIGDPASVAFTKECQRLGWEGAGTSFDVLPLVVKIGDREPKWYAIPESLVLEVPMVHPQIETFGNLGLRWYAVPMISDMGLDLGGINYTAAPFNGWYMGTEIGSRNLADVDRYDSLPSIADLIGLDRSTNTSLWKDRALLELNTAVIYSFKQRGVSIVDHHTAAEQFMRFMRREQDQGRDVNARWSWLIPPMSPASTPIWNQSLSEREIKPDFVAQPRMF